MASGVLVCGIFIPIAKYEHSNYLTFYVPKKSIGQIIGKNRRIVRNIAQKSHCCVDIDDVECIITIHCISKNGLSNANIFSEFWTIVSIVQKNEPMFTCEHKSLPGLFFESVLEIGEKSSTLTVSNVPEQAVPVIIGKGGHNVATIAASEHVNVDLRETSFTITSRHAPYNANVATSNIYAAFWYIVATYYHAVIINTPIAY